MPGKLKCRRVCAIPQNKVFLPQQPFGGMSKLTVEELETVRLCDLERMEQDDAAISMNVSRATFQRTLYQAREKIADALCNGKAIRIGGGNYELAQHPCGCHRRCRHCRFEIESKKKEEKDE